jgi:hypothetical protein
VDRPTPSYPPKFPVKSESLTTSSYLMELLLSCFLIFLLVGDLGLLETFYSTHENSDKQDQFYYHQRTTGMPNSLHIVSASAHFNTPYSTHHFLAIRLVGTWRKRLS